MRPLLATLLLAVACSASPADPVPAPIRPAPSSAPGTASDPATVALTLSGPDAEHTLEVEVADDPAERGYGLMERTELAADAGMVFRFPSDTDGGFYMKNTRIPLSIAFFDRRGEILRVLDMDPCTAGPCPTYNPELVYRGALEVNQGRFDDLGVEEGWRVRLPEGLGPAQ
ncbi:MAG: DUF192 domain-containing protein [Actinomycetota bacterium]|jgi:uncharacterized membrane protein (UPF0127 family)|nr:DUF192 domain-containing protein [Actinomycetota bacterium]